MHPHWKPVNLLCSCSGYESATGMHKLEILAVPVGLKFCIDKRINEIKSIGPQFETRTLLKNIECFSKKKKWTKKELG